MRLRSDICGKAIGTMLRERASALISLATLTGYVAAVSIWKPGSTVLLPCPFHALTGFYCPGCGMTRMLYHLVHGQVTLAFAQNALAFLALPFVVWAIGQALLPQRWAGRFPVSPRWTYVLIASIAVFTVLRNIPAWPASMLAPGG